MENVFAMLRLFGERYIYCSNEQAEMDFLTNREDLQECFGAIMDYVQLKQVGEINE